MFALLFFFIDPQLGLGYVRVPTWCPFRLQVYINGHNLLASELKLAEINYTMIDNAFDSIQDAAKAQELSDKISIEKLHRKLEEFAWQFCPVYKDFNLRYHWSVMQAEYATDIVFKKQEYLQQIYSELMATAGACFCTRGAMQGYDGYYLILALAKTVTP